MADLATQAAVSAPTEGRALYAELRALDVLEEPVARLQAFTKLNATLMNIQAVQLIIER